jgi:hypothetical protein
MFSGITNLRVWLIGMSWIYFNRYGFSHPQWLAMKVLGWLRPHGELAWNRVKLRMRDRNNKVEAEKLRQEFLRHLRHGRTVDIYRHH